MIPFYVLVKDEHTLKSVNDKFTKLLFLPIATLLTLFFFVSSILMVPFAYFCAISKKVSLIRNPPGVKDHNLMLQIKRSKTQRISDKKRGGNQDLAMFVFLGLPILLCDTFRDTMQFAKELYRNDIKLIGHNDCKDEYNLDEEQFIALERFISEEYFKLQKEVEKRRI